MEKRTEEWWDRFFLGMAKYVATASKDPSTQVGSIIVQPDTNLIVGLGYNGFPRGVKDLPERYENRKLKYSLVVHSEVNAIIMAGEKAKGSRLYVWPSFVLPPTCSECAKLVVQSGIKEVVGYEPDLSDERVQRWADSIKVAQQMYEEAGVTWRGIKE